MKFEIYNHGGYKFRLTSDSGEILAVSPEPQATIDRVRWAVEQIIADAREAEIVEILDVIGY